MRKALCALELRKTGLGGEVEARGLVPWALS